MFDRKSTNRLIMGVLILCIFFTFSSCGSDGQLPYVDLDTPKTTDDLDNIREQIGAAEPVTRGSGLNEQEILASINNCESFFECFAPDAGFVAASIQINQRDTQRQESDEIYANITAINEFSSFTAEFYLYYEYYREGGWRLEALRQNSDGTYYINYWPQEEDLYTVWADTYCEIYDNGIIESCNIESSGNDYVMFLVEYSHSSEIASKYQKVEIRFGFDGGLWTTASMPYPSDPVLELNSDFVRGIYVGARVTDKSLSVAIFNIYTCPPDSLIAQFSDVQIDLYEYYVDTGSYQANFDSSPNRAPFFNLYSIGTKNDEMILQPDGTFRYDGISMERINSDLDIAFTEEDACSLIQEIVEDNGFPFWDSTSAQAAPYKAAYQSGLEELNQLANVVVYRQACIELYNDVELEFPDDLDPCMYNMYL